MLYLCIVIFETMTFNIQLKKEDSIYEAYLTYINPIFAQRDYRDWETNF